MARGDMEEDGGGFRRVMEEDSGWRRMRRVVSVVAGCVLAACIVGSLVRGRQERRASVLLTLDDLGKSWEGGELDGIRAHQVAAIIVQAGLDEDKLENVQKDQDIIDAKIASIIGGMQTDYESSLNAARKASMALEGNLTQMNDAAVYAAMLKANATIAEHAHKTEQRLNAFTVASLSRIKSFSQSFSTRFAELRGRILDDKGKDEEARTKIKESANNLDLAIMGYEMLTGQRVAKLAASIEELRQQIKAAVQDAKNQLDATDKEVGNKLQQGLQGTRTFADTTAQTVRVEVIKEFDQTMKDLAASIDGLKQRSTSQVTAAKQHIQDVQDAHAKQSKVLSDKAQSLEWDAATAQKHMDAKATELQNLVDSLKASINQGRAALKNENAASLSDIESKMGTAVEDLKNMISAKTTKYNELALVVKDMLRSALSLEMQSKGWNHDRQEQEVADMTNQMQQTNNGVGDLERVVHTIDAKQMAGESVNTVHLHPDMQ